MTDWLIDWFHLGKTESSKLIVSQLIHCSGDVGNRELRNRIIEVWEKSSKEFVAFSFSFQTSPLLEAFGNAQTCRNQNSSRFGKYLQLNFNEHGRIIGGILWFRWIHCFENFDILAKVYEYLLEKSRVVQHGPGERTFHFFYYLFAGLEKEALEYFYLDDPETYR